MYALLPNAVHSLFAHIGAVTHTLTLPAATVKSKKTPTKYDHYLIADPDAAAFLAQATPLCHSMLQITDVDVDAITVDKYLKYTYNDTLLKYGLGYYQYKTPEAIKGNRRVLLYDRVSTRTYTRHHRHHRQITPP